MEHLRLFETLDEYNAATLNDSTVSLIKNDNCINIYKRDLFVDLGLPSGTKWAKCNIGAENETDFGLYFQWGSTVGYSSDEAEAHSYWSTCPGNGGSSDYDSEAFSTWKAENLTDGVLNTSVDAAYQATNGKVKMPTFDQLSELINETNLEWTTINGVAGTKFTNKTDSSKYIFIPAVVEGIDGNFKYMWSSSLLTHYMAAAFMLVYMNDDVTLNTRPRCNCLPVRGVSVV